MAHGHRKRVYEKLKANNTFFDHEVLEILLFNAYPRIDTNPIAHALLQRFPSLYAVLHADVQELTSIPNVGENVALYLKTVGMCMDKCQAKEYFTIMDNIQDMVKFIALRFDGMINEMVEIYMLDDKNKVVRILSFTDKRSTHVHVPIQELMDGLNHVKPKGIVVAHNHTDKISLPSGMDHGFTQQVKAICHMFHVHFYDHIVYVSPQNYYSYRKENTLDIIDGTMVKLGELLL